MSEQTHTARDRAVRRAADYLAAMLEMPDAFRGQQLRGAGPVAEFESLLAERSGFPFCLSTSNATTGLLIAALAAQLAGKEIIVPPRSWGGTYGPFEFAGARLVWAEEDARGNISPASIQSLSTPAMTAVVAADWNGTRHDTRAVREVCEARNLLYIEDTSFLPSPDDETETRSLADIQIISFGPGKPITLGEGGALLTRHRWIYEKAIALCQHPERCSSEGIADCPERPFLNGRIHPIAAVLGVAFLSAEIRSYSSLFPAQRVSGDRTCHGETIERHATTV